MRENPASERRQPLPRIDCSAAKVKVILSLPLQEPLRGTLTDLSRDGMGVALTEMLSPDFPALAQVTVNLGQDLLLGRPARIAHATAKKTQAGRSAQHLGLQFLIDSEQPLSKLTFAHTDSDWDLIRDKEDLQDLFNDLLAHGAGSEIRVHREQEMIIGTLAEGGQQAEQKQIPVVLKDGEIILAKDKPLVVTFERYGCTYLFHAEVKQQKGAEIVFTMPKAAIRLLRRRTSRLAGQATADFSLEITHPLLREKISGLPVLEINEQGCLTRLPPSFNIYPIYLSRIPLLLGWGMPSSAADPAQVAEPATAPARQSASFFAAVCSVRLDARGGCLVGLAFNFPDEDGRRLLTAELIHRRRPMIDIVYREEDHKQIWKLLDESKYLDEKSRESFAPMVETTKQVWRQLQEGMDFISRKILVRKGERVLGHLQMDRGYPDTWLVHHLAIHPEMSKLIAGEMYSTITDFLSGRNIRYLMSVTREDKAWNKRNYYDFIARYPYPHHHFIKTYHLFEHDLMGIDANSANPLIVDTPTLYDLRTIARYFEIHFPALAVKALALTPDDLLLKKHSSLFRGYGLQRSRKFILYKMNRLLLGFAMLDEGSTGINVFGLYDKFSVYVLKDAKESCKKIEAALIRAALAYYKRIGKTTVLYFTDRPSEEWPSDVGLKFVFDEVLWIADCTASKRYEAFSKTLYGRLLARRMQRRQ